MLLAFRCDDSGVAWRVRCFAMVASIFDKQSTKTLRQLACWAERVQRNAGEPIFRQGDQPDGLYVLDEGFCSVEVEGLGTLATLSDEGAAFGELALFLDDVRSATVRAQSEVRLLRVESKHVMSTLRESWGDHEEMEHRAECVCCPAVLYQNIFCQLPRDHLRLALRSMLGQIELFSLLRRAELLVLAAHMERKVFNRPDVKIITEGTQGHHLYLLEKGHPMVTIKNVGRVRELEEGEIFGELAVLQSPYHYRTATVTTVDIETVVWALTQEDVYRLIPFQRRKDTLAKCQHTYDERASIRTSSHIVQEIDRFWNLVYTYSQSLHESDKDRTKSNPDFWRALKRTLSRGQIQRKAYEELHIRISKVLAPGPTFSVQKALQVTEHDWCEDITAFDGEASSSVHIELVKEKLVRKVQKQVSKTGWRSLFSKYDDDGSGTLSFAEFQKAVRNDMKIPTRDMVLLHDFEQRQAAAKLATATAVAPAAGRAVFHLMGVANRAMHRRGELSSIDPMLMRDTIEDKDLKRLFKAADVDGGGDISGYEFAAYMAKPATKDRHRKVLQAAAREQVLKIGWDALFQKVDLDGSGELDYEEFEAVIREHCELDEKAVSNHNLRHLFDAMDKDGSKTIDVKELTEALCYHPFDQDMRYDVFAESIFQLASGWVENKSLGGIWGSGCTTDEEKYVRFLRFLWYRITDAEEMMPLEQVKMASQGPNGLDFAQLTAKEARARKRATAPKLALKETAKAIVVGVRAMRRNDSEVFRDTWESRAAHVKERRLAVLSARAEAAQQKALRAAQVKQRRDAAERDAAKIQSSPCVAVEELPLPAQNLLATAQFSQDDGSQAASTISAGTVVGGICHGQGNGARTAAVFNRVYIQPVAVHDPDAAHKARLTNISKLKAQGAAKRRSKQQRSGHGRTSAAEPEAEPEPEPEQELELEPELDTVRRKVYEAYTRMLDENAFWKAPEWLATQQMAAAGIATPYLHGGLQAHCREMPMRHGAGGAGNRWVADLAGVQSGSDRICRMQLAVDASPRGTPRSLVSQQRFPSRSRLVKPQTSPQTERTIVHNVLSVQTEERATPSAYMEEASQELLQQSEHREKSVGPAGFRSPRPAHDSMALSQRLPAPSQSPVRALFRAADNPHESQHVPFPPTTPKLAERALIREARYIATLVSHRHVHGQ